MCGTEQLYFTTQGLTGLQGTREEKTEKQKDGPTGWRHSTYRRVTSTFELPDFLLYPIHTDHRYNLKLHERMILI